MNFLNYIEQQEATDISYVKIGDNNKKLIATKQTKKLNNNKQIIRCQKKTKKHQ